MQHISLRLLGIMLAIIATVILGNSYVGWNAEHVLRFCAVCILAYGMVRLSWMNPLLEEIVPGLFLFGFGAVLIVPEPFSELGVLLMLMLLLVSTHAIVARMRNLKRPPRHPILLTAGLLSGGSLLVHLAPYWLAYESMQFVATAILGAVLFGIGAWSGRRLTH